MTQEFTGFPAEALQFLADLAANNIKAWFDEHKDVFQNKVLVPTQAFIVALGQRLQTIEPGIQFDPRTNGQGSMMRIYRDVRFSKDKSPYNTHIAAMFWEGESKRHHGPVFGFSLEADGLRVMEGLWQFPKERLDTYRKAVADPTLGAELDAALAAIRKAGSYTVVGEHYKRVPDGYDPNHPRAALLRHDGLYVHPEKIPANAVSSPDLVERCAAHFQNTLPLHRWLRRVLAA